MSGFHCFFRDAENTCKSCLKWACRMGGLGIECPVLYLSDKYSVMPMVSWKLKVTIHNTSYLYASKTMWLEVKSLLSLPSRVQVKT